MARENSEYTRVFQGIVQDRLLHRGKDKSDVGSVGGLRQAKKSVRRPTKYRNTEEQLTEGRGSGEPC